MKIAVNVKTEQEYNILMQTYEAKGWVWCDESKPTSHNKWESYGSVTCVSFENKFGYSPAHFYKDEGTQIITLNQALKELNMHKLSTLKAGDYIISNGGWFRRVLSDVQHTELGELATVLVSQDAEKKDGHALKLADKWLTLFQLEGGNYELETEEEVVEMTVQDVEKLTGKKVKIVK